MNILIKLMSIVSLVIAPTLATLSGETASTKKEKNVSREVLITKAGDTNTKDVTLTNDKGQMNTATDKLVNALAADNLLKKDNFALSVKKGKVAVDGAVLKDDVAVKYQSLIAALQGTDIELKNSQN
jgi:hypothetical protein